MYYPLFAMIGVTVAGIAAMVVLGTLADRWPSAMDVWKNRFETAVAGLMVVLPLLASAS